MKRLFTFGCSFTAGEGLPDKLGKKQNIAELKSQYAWPAVLGEMSGRKLINKAEGGMSNKQIWYSILNTDFDSTDQVIIQWSYTERFAVIKKEQENLVFGSWCNDKISKFYYKNIYDDYDAYIDYFHRQDHAKRFLDDLGIENYHVFNDSHIKSCPEWSSVKYLDIDMEDIRTKFPLADDGFHPGVEAQRQYAKTIFDCIQNKKFRTLKIE
jgi:hypothetical protein